MKLLRKLLRVLKWFGLGVLVLLVVYGLLALVLPRITVNSDFRASEHGVTIYVLSNSVHADFIVPAITPVMDWTKELPHDAFERADAASAGSRSAGAIAASISRRRPGPT